MEAQRSPGARIPSIGGRLEVVVDAIGRAESLDGPASKMASTVGRVRSPGVAGVLSGTWLGHPLHPVLTDLPIGCWTSAWLLDLVGGRSSRPAARRLIGLGVLAAVPTALTGLSDWADTEGPPRRVGVVHAAANSVGLACFAMSWVSRRRGRHGLGVLLGMVGASAATVAGHLGGHLVYRRGTGVDVNAPSERKEEWTPLEPAQPRPPDDGAFLAHADSEPILVTHAADGWHGIGDRCSHRGGPLHEGTVGDGCVTCPWHASQFRTTDGAVLTGPATHPQPRYEVRESEGGFEARSVS